ncbi:MAG TPA: putative baseplate assembly protein [Pyrinomonadaceae bacterium]|nr:putative baseplate assembly protein [Pyrinomonadaceae bacterium]
MIGKPIALLDDRNVDQIATDLLARRLGYVPNWTPKTKGADAAIAQIAARYLYAVVQRLNQSPEKNKLAFFDLLGLSLVPAQAARAPIVFQLAPDAPDSLANKGIQVAAAPPPGSSDQIVFETEQAVGLAAGQLTQVFSLWPGRDQYIDHSADFLAAKSINPFRKSILEDTPHTIYLAHDRLLAIAGVASVVVEFELMQKSSEALTVLWQYWDGKVWRPFKFVRPACSLKDAEHADGTAGLTTNGKFILESDCAESKKTTVNNIEAYWIRGQLIEPLPPDPAKALPVVETIRLSTVIRQELKASITAEAPVPDGPLDGENIQFQGTVKNEAGAPLEEVLVRISSPSNPNFPEQSDLTGLDGEYILTGLNHEDDYEIRVAFWNLEGVTRRATPEPGRSITLDLTLNVTGIEPEFAFSDATKLDLTKPFYPFGQQPQPGSTFYFSSEEIFSKPGAKMQVYIARTITPLDQFDIPSDTNSDDLEHLIAFEYWNGRRWATLAHSQDFTDATEILDFPDVPRDMVKTKVNDQEGYWMRARLIRGGFGFHAEIPTNSGTETPNTFKVVITQPPALAAFRIGYTWASPPEHAEQVLTYNDFQFADYTYEAKWPGETFLPFRFVDDVTPALYLGFTRKLPVDNIGIYFDVVDQEGETKGPALHWEYLNGSSWEELSVEDETRNFRVPGIVSFIAAEDSQPLKRFGTELHFIRARLKEDGPPGEPRLNGIFPNAVWASQQRTLNDAVLGVSNGMANQVLRFAQIPVLAGERIEVRELSGARANVEWRVLALQVTNNDPNVVREFEEMLAQEGTQLEFTRGELRLRRDRNKKVVEVWVHWTEQPHFFDSGPEDRHYVIDRARGLVFFGDGEDGKIPPPQAQVVSRQHRSGGGLAGNVASGGIKQLLGGIAGVQKVFNPRAAEGGADAETIEQCSIRGPLTIRHRGRAITPPDYETLAREASPAVAFARAIPTRNASGRPLPGWVTLLIIPQSEDARPWPSFGLRQHILKYIEERAPADLVGSGQIYVTGPDYLAIDVTATLSPIDPAEAGIVEKAARQALEDFFHPLRGGPDRRGWELGRDVYVSDVAAVLERVKGVDYVKELTLFVNGNLQGERIPIADDRVVVAGVIRLKLEAAEG